jgi:hypothetical protein
MATTTDIKKALTDSTPFYAVAGAGDLAVEKLREVQARLSTIKVEPKVVQDRVTGSLTTIQDDVRTLPEKAQSFALTQVGKASEAYEDLAQRGKTVVRRIRGQQATKDLKAQARSTTTRAKATQTTARKAVTSTSQATKGTATSAGRTAKAAEKATRAGAGKVG